MGRLRYGRGDFRWCRYCDTELDKRRQETCRCEETVECFGCNADVARGDTVRHPNDDQLLYCGNDCILRELEAQIVSEEEAGRTFREQGKTEVAEISAAWVASYRKDLAEIRERLAGKVTP